MNQYPFHTQHTQTMFVYVVNCIQAFKIVKEYVRLQGANRNDNAISIARSRVGGCLAYSIAEIQSDIK